MTWDLKSALSLGQKMSILLSWLIPFWRQLFERWILISACSRLDLVPINRSVGLKAKPTKPVTEVLRPVVAKYGLHLSDLVARIVSLVLER